MTAAIREPGTEAGRRLLRILDDFDAHPTMDIREVVRLNIGTIEAEARAAEPAPDLLAYRQPYTVAALVLSEKLGPNDLWLGEVLAIEDEMEARALASADGPPEPGIDVERLARALIAVDLDADSQPTQHPDYWRWVADRVAQFEERDR